jgi:hypothetical protein
MASTELMLNSLNTVVGVAILRNCKIYMVFLAALSLTLANLAIAHLLKSSI